MHTSPRDGNSPLGPQLCSTQGGCQSQDDDGITAFRGMLLAGTASIILWGICIAVVMMLRSKS